MALVGYGLTQIPPVKKDLHPEKRAKNSLKRLSGQVLGILVMFLVKRPKHEILLQLLAAHNALKKIILLYFRDSVKTELQVRIQELLSLPNLSKNDAKTLNDINVQLNAMSTRRIVKVHFILEKIERQMRLQNTHC